MEDQSSFKLLTLYICVFLASLGVSVWSTLFPVYLNRVVGLEASLVGLLYTFLNSTGSLFLLFTGFLADSMGRIKVLRIGLLLSVASPVLAGFTRIPGVIGLAAALQGVASSFQTPAALAVVSERSSGTAFSIFYLGSMLGFVLGSLLAGFLASSLGYSSLFAAAAFIVGVASILTYGISDEAGGNPSVRLELKRSLQALPKGLAYVVWRNRRLSLITLALIFHSLGFSQVNPLITLYAKQYLSLDEMYIGFITAALNVGLLVAQLPSGRLVDVFGGTSILALHVGLSSFSWLAYGYSWSLASSLASSAAMGLIGALDMPARRLIMVKFRGSIGRGTVMGYIDAITGSAAMVGASLGGYLWSNYGYRTPFWAAALVNLFGLIPLVILRREEA